ncbi:MAG: PilZ domain-containing protein [Pseudomonadota bacterium]
MSFAERRAYLRYKKSIPVKLTDMDGSTYDVVTHDISLGGMSLSCTKSVVTKILPNGIKTEPGDRIMLDAQLNMNSSDAISLRGHALSAIRIAESEFYIRVSFIELDEKQQDTLQNILNQ